MARQIRDLAATAPRRAELLLAGREAKRLLDGDARAALRTVIAQSYLAAGEAQEALVMSAAPQSADYAPIAHWNAGLAAWRLGRLDEARAHFQALAQKPRRIGLDQIGGRVLGGARRAARAAGPST